MASACLFCEPTMPFAAWWSPPAPGGWNICNINHPGREFDEAYKSQLIQFYVDEIALSQVEIERGLDCQVKLWAAKVIRNDQIRIARLTRCTVCG